MAKKRKLSKKGKIKLFISIFLIVLIGIGFAIYLSVAVVLSIIELPLFYHGIIYECPKCGHKFKANPYKVFFTNGILGILDFDGSGNKYAKLKCPNCKAKDWCKKHYDSSKKE